MKKKRAQSPTDTQRKDMYGLFTEGQACIAETVMERCSNVSIGKNKAKRKIQNLKNTVKLCKLM